MSRRTHFTRGLSSSWLATLATVIYGFASVPIALHFLSVEEFGLFMLILQIAGYFTLIELGMAGAAARILVDYKDRPGDGAYGSVILTASLVFAVQAVLIAVVGLMAAPWVVGIAGVPTNLHAPAIYLLRWLCVTFAFATGLRTLSSLLYANKRLDVLNAITGISVLSGLALMAIILASGAGLKGLVIMFVTQIGITAFLNGLACWKFRLFPGLGQWSRPSFDRFLELFSLAKDFFLVNIGNQLLEASQLIIVTRTMGLLAAATWSVSTKLFTLFYQLLTKIQGTAAVFLAEMMVREESEKLENRYRQIFQITAGLAAISLTAATAVNIPFVSAWAKPSLAWALPLSILMATWVFLNTVTRCHVELIIHTKRIKALRYIYFVEAAAFVSLALLLSPHIGFYGILVSALGCLILARFWYVTWRVAKYFHISKWQVAWQWSRRSMFTVLFMAPFVWAAHPLSNLVAIPWLRVAIAACWISIPSLIALFAIALPKDVTREAKDYIFQLLPSRRK